MTTPNPIQISRDVSGIPKYGIQPAQLSYIINAAAGATPTLVVPGTAGSGKFYDVLFEIQPGTTVLVSSNATPPDPTSSFVAGTTELNPALRTWPAGATIYFKAIDAAIICVCFTPSV